MDGVKALVFDVFGTVVDWRSSIARHGAAFGADHGIDADWEAFAVGWRGKYQPYMNKVRTGELPWTKLDVLHRMGLVELLGEFGITMSASTPSTSSTWPGTTSTRGPTPPPGCPASRPSTSSAPCPTATSP